MTLLTLSDGQTTPKFDSHNHSLESILESMSKAKEGSKSFKRKQSQRNNFVNYSINQLNLNDIKQINLEKLKDIGRGKKKIEKFKLI